MEAILKDVLLLEVSCWKKKIEMSDRIIVYMGNQMK